MAAITPNDPPINPMIVAIVFWWYFLSTKLKILEKKISPVIDPRVKFVENLPSNLFYMGQI